MIDTHTHVVASEDVRYPLRPRDPSASWYLEAPHTAGQLLALMDEADVSKAVLVQAVGAYSYDNDYAADSGAAHSDRFVSACCIDVLASDASKTLHYWVRDRGMQGVRFFAIARPGSCWIEDERTLPVWREAADLGIHVIVTIFSHQLSALQRMLKRHPEIRVSLDHCGFPALAGAPWREAEPLYALAESPNLHCKVSSIVLDSAARSGEPASSFVERLVSVFGAERVMWGSDFSQTHDRPYAELVRMAREAFGTLSPSQREQCLDATPRSLWPALG